MYSIIPPEQKLLPLKAVPGLSWMPPGRRGGRLSYGAVFRWASGGVRGHKLRTVRVGGSLMTCEAWVADFVHRLTAGAAPGDKTPADWRRELEDAERRLDAAGARPAGAAGHAPKGPSLFDPA